MYFLKKMGILPQILGGAFIFGGLTFNTIAMETHETSKGESSTQIDMDIPGLVLVENPLFGSVNEDSSLTNPLAMSQVLVETNQGSEVFSSESDVQVNTTATSKTYISRIQLEEIKKDLEEKNSILMLEVQEINIKNAGLTKEKESLETINKTKIQEIQNKNKRISLLETQRKFGAPLIVLLLSYFFYTFF